MKLINTSSYCRIQALQAHSSKAAITKQTNDKAGGILTVTHVKAAEISVILSKKIFVTVSYICHKILHILNNIRFRN